MAARLSLLLLLCLLAGAARAQVVPYCQASITSPTIVGCIECLSSNRRCYYCDHRKSPIWTGDPAAPVLSECRPLTYGQPCRVIDPNCQACELTTSTPKPFAANKCIKCLPAFGVVNNKCVRIVGTVATEVNNCRITSMNANCAECHRDATCKRCPFNLPFLSPMNAIWLDAGQPETQCTSKVDIAARAKEIAGIDLMAPGAIHDLCRELDTDFRCAACLNWAAAEPRGYGPVKTADPNKIACTPNDGFVAKDDRTGGRIDSTAAVPIGRNGCYMQLPYMQYCLKCSANGRVCQECTGSRSVDPDGLCSFNCKAMYGIGCKTCHAFNCLTYDTNYASGR